MNDRLASAAVTAAWATLLALTCFGCLYTWGWTIIAIPTAVMLFRPWVSGRPEVARSLVAEAEVY